MLFEISRSFIHINKHEQPTIWWDNSVLTVRRNKNLVLFDYACNISSVEKKIICNESSINCSNNSPISPEFLRAYVKQGIKNSELIEMITDPSLRSHNSMIVKEMAHISAFEWSPTDIIFNHQKILAIVNSNGNVDLFASKRCGWSNIMNFSKTINEHLKSPDSLKKVPSDFNKIKAIAYSLSTTAICWASELNEDGSCIFVTAQKSGQIFFWNVKCNFLDVESVFCGRIEGHIAEVQAMLWIPLHETECLLLCSNILGQIVGYQCTINESAMIQLNQEHGIWTHEDRMVAKYLYYTKHDDKIVIICNKHRHLLVQMYDSKLKLLSEVIKPVNDYRITSISKSSNGFYLTTVNAKIFKITFNIVNNNINVTLDCVELKESYRAYDLYGLGISQNSALFAMIIINRKIQIRKDVLKIEVVFLWPENSFEHEIIEIIKNPTKKLYLMWDYLEIVRYKILKTKGIPNIDLVKLLTEGNSDLYKLKAYLAFLRLCTNVKLTKAINLSPLLPEKSIETVQEEIFAKHACSMLNNIHKESQNSKLDNFKSECSIGAKKYLEYYCKKYKKNITEIVSEEILKLFNANILYMCQCCDGQIEGFTCSLGHLNMFCSYTFTPINSNDYLICKYCNVTARSELYEQKPSCVLCDSYLDFYEMT